MTKLKKGSKGDLVAAVQYILGASTKEADGKYGAKTLKAVLAYKKAHGLPEHGTVGQGMWNAILKEAPTLRIGDTGKYVRALEVLLNLTLDGVYAQAEAAHVTTYQAVQGLSVDGVVGPQTWRALLGLNEGTADTTTPPAATNSRPKDFKQYASAWANKIYSITGNTSQTMKSSGCGPTAAADVVAPLCDPSVTPWTLAQLFMKNGFRTKNSGTAWAAFKWVFQHYTEFSKFVQTSSHATAIAALNQGALGIASMGPGLWTKAGHFLCLWKCDGKKMYACDPASATRKNQNLDAFKNQVRQYFIFYPA